MILLYFVHRSNGIRDDLLFLLDEELSSIQLCALHMEMRNTEQLLASVGLLAYKIDSLKEANSALKYYGPESFHGDRLTVKKKSEQQSAISRHNIHVSSMSGQFSLDHCNVFHLECHNVLWIFSVTTFIIFQP